MSAGEGGIPSDQKGPWDAVVIGSGFAGAVTACRLAEAGIGVCILERGRRFGPGDFPAHPVTASADVPEDAAQASRDAIQPDVSRLLWKLGNGVWDLRDLGDLVVGQAAGLGGGSLIYANVHLRPPAHVFDERWPARYRRPTLEEYFDLAAMMLQVETLPAEHATLPKRIQLERAAHRTRLARDVEYLRSFSPPLAVNFSREENLFGAKQKACDLAGNCCFGCPAQAKNTLDLNYLRRAEERGAQVITLAEVIWLEQLDGGFRIVYRDHLAGGAERSLDARHVFLCAGAVNTTELLLRNRAAGKLHPTGAGLGSCFHPNQDALAVVFDCDEAQELDRGPTITTSLVYDRLPDDDESSARWRLAFDRASAEPELGDVITCGGASALVAAPPRLISGSYPQGDAAGELTLAELRGAFPMRAPLASRSGLWGRVAGEPHKVRHWFLIQDGGLPVALEPMLGLFRSPLWLHRNAYRERPAARRDVKRVRPESTERAAVSQRIGYAPLPFRALTELFSGLTRSAARPAAVLAHEVGRLSLQLLRAAPGEGGAAGEPQQPGATWSLLPDQLQDALARIRRRTLDDASLAAEDLVGSFLDDAARGIEPELQRALSGTRLGEHPEALGGIDLPGRALRLGVHLLWGSQGGLARAIALRLVEGVLPDRGVVEGGVDLLRWLLDYRLGDGHSAVMLSMGLDSAPGNLELAAPEEPRTGTELRGVSSGARALLLRVLERTGSRLAGDARGVVLFSRATGDFELGETLLADGRPIGVFEGRTALSASAEDPWLARMAAGLPLGAAHYGPAAGPAAQPPALVVPLRARLPEAVDTPERGVQERILRDLASAWGGELRTDPLWPFLGRRVTVHAQGGCPMGPPARGVTDELGLVHGCPGLYVMDAAAFPGPVGANPSATIAAIAEYKVARFLEARYGRDDSRARRLERLRATAKQWVDKRRPQLDPFGPDDRGPHSAAPAHAPVGIEFEERMVGHANLGAATLAIETSLHAKIDDLAGFLGRHARDSTVPVPLVRGTLTLDSQELPIDPERSVMRVMTDRGPHASGREVRRIEYDVFVSEGGLRLTGAKTIRDDEGPDVWADTTTLPFELFSLVTGASLGCGELRLPATEFFGRQVHSFRVNTDDPARQAWALLSFGRFFLGNLVDVYLPGLDRLGELGTNLVKSGHA